MRAGSTRLRIQIVDKVLPLKNSGALKAAAAIALWYAMHFWVLLWALVHALPQFGDAPHVTYPETSAVLGVLDAWWPWRAGTSVGWFLLQVFTVGLAVFWLLGALLARVLAQLGIAGIHELTGDAWWWALRQALRTPVFWLGVGLIAALVISDGMDAPELVTELTGVAAVILFLAMPVVVLNGAGHATPGLALPASRSRWQAASIFYLGVALLQVLGYAVRTQLDAAGRTGWFLGVLEAAAESWVMLCLISVLAYRIGWRQLRTELSNRLRVRFLALSLLLDLRVLMVVLWVAPSLLLAEIVAIHVLPTYEATLRATGAIPNPGYQFAVDLMDYTLSYWWMLMLPLSVPFLLACRRSLAMFDQAERLNGEVT